MKSTYVTSSKVRISLEDFSDLDYCMNSKKKKKKRKHEEIDEKSADTNVEVVKKPKFDISKLKELINNDLTKKTTGDAEAPKNSSPHVAKLKSAQFRHLNEKLYTQSGSQSLKMFQNDPESFKVYHEGFRHQAEKWPVDPLNLIIASIMKM